MDLVHWVEEALKLGATRAAIIDVPAINFVEDFPQSLRAEHLPEIQYELGMPARGRRF